VWAVVPLKSIRRAKQRLASLLTPTERGELMLAMVGDVLDALTQTPDLAGILLVSRAPEAADLARQHRCELYAEAAGADLSESVQAAGGYLVANRHARGTLIVPGDLPLITAADVATILDQHQQITLVPDSEGDGTNCIVSSPPNLIRYRFDGHSFVVGLGEQHVDDEANFGLFALLCQPTNTLMFFPQLVVALDVGIEHTERHI